MQHLILPPLLTITNGRKDESHGAGAQQVALPTGGRRLHSVGVVEMAFQCIP